jgi:hypothetical protein
MPPPGIHVGGGVHNSVVVQGDNDNVRVTFGRDHIPYLARNDLAYVRRLIRLGDPLRSGLDPFTRTTSFLGRSSELASLVSWAKSDRSISICLLTGLPGVGKTRIALELCTSLDPCGWSAGFLTIDQINRYGSSWNIGSYELERPTLIVIDDAIQFGIALEPFLREVAERQEAGYSLRILLIDRNLHARAPIYEEWFGRSGWENDAWRLLEPRCPIELSPLNDENVRCEVFKEGISIANRELSKVDLDIESLERLRNVSWAGLPCYLLMAGFSAGKAGIASWISLSDADVASALANYEHKRLQSLVTSIFGSGVSSEVRGSVDLIVSFVTLLREIDLKQLQDSFVEISDVPDYLKLLSDFNLLSPTDKIKGILPRPVGDAFVFLRLIQHDKAPDVVLRAYRVAPRHVVTSLINIAQTFVKDAQAPCLKCLLACIRDYAGESARLSEIANLLPRGDSVLTRVGAAVQEKLIQALAGWVGVDSDCKYRIACAWHNLSTHLSFMELREQAIRYEELSINTLKELVTTRPDLRSALAVALNGFSNCLADQRLWIRALGAAKESVAIYEELERIEPVTIDFLSSYGCALNNLAIRTLQCGDKFQAVKIAERSVGARRSCEKIARSPHDAINGGLAQSLCTLGGMYIDVGRHEEAKTVLEESRQIYRRGCAIYPTVFTSALAYTYMQEANALFERGKERDALNVATQAIDGIVKIFDTDPIAFEKRARDLLANWDRMWHAVGGSRPLTIIQMQSALMRVKIARTTERAASVESQLQVFIDALETEKMDKSRDPGIFFPSASDSDEITIR